MTRIATHSKIVQFHREIAAAHNDINGFYRFNWAEINGKFRAGIQTPALLLESHSLGLKPNQNNTTTFSHRDISFMLLDFTGKADAYDKQETTLDELENVALDICSYLNKLHHDKTSWLYGLIELDKVEIEKVGPIFDNMYGWNVKYTLKNKESMIFDVSKWTF